MLGAILTFLSGIAASFLAWFLVSVLVKPKLQIDDKLYKFKSIDYKGSFVYKVKVTNLSTFFAAYDVVLAARVYIYGLVSSDPTMYRTYVISPGAKNIPYITKAGGKSDQFSGNERFFILKPPYFDRKDKGKLRKLYNENHETEPLDVIMTLEDVFNIIDEQKDKTTIEFMITATSTFSASRTYTTKCFRLTDIETVDEFDGESLME